MSELQSIKGNLWDSKGLTDHPVNIVNEMIGQQTEYNETMSAINQIERENNALAKYTQQDLERLIADIEPKVNANQGGRVIIGIDGPQPEVRNLSASELRDFLAEARARLSVLETPTADPVSGNPDFSLDDFTPYESEKERKKREREAAAAAAVLKSRPERTSRPLSTVPKERGRATRRRMSATILPG